MAKLADPTHMYMKVEVNLQSLCCRRLAHANWFNQSLSGLTLESASSPAGFDWLTHLIEGPDNILIEGPDNMCSQLVLRLES